MPLAPLRLAPSDRSEMVSQILAGERCKLIQAGELDWIEVELISDSYRGWCDAKQFRLLPLEMKNELASHALLTEAPISFWRLENGGQLLLPAGSRLVCNCAGEWRLGEQALEPITDLDTCFSPCASPLDSALNFLGAPYLWGGKSILGMDCSGLIQVSFALNGVRLPRDASDQVNCGDSIRWEERDSGDLVFFNNTKGAVVHVGILESKDSVLHAAGSVRLDSIDSKGIRREGAYTHVFHCIRRVKS